MLDLKARIAISTATQEQVAAVLGMNPPQLSRILRGLRPIPKRRPDFYAEVRAAIRRVEAADAAAEESRRRVMEGDKEGYDEQIGLFN